MLIESAGSRLVYDLIITLEKLKMSVTEIRVSYRQIGGEITYRTFTGESFKTNFLNTYQNLINSKRNPFTKYRQFAQIGPAIVNGDVRGKITIDPNEIVTIPGFCKLGDFVKIEHMILKSSSFNYEMGFKILDVSNVFKIIEEISVDIRRNLKRDREIKRHKKTISNTINIYKQILDRLLTAYNASLYVDLCYVLPGYVKESLLIYSIFYSIVKRNLNSIISLEVLEPVYLKQIV